MHNKSYHQSKKKKNQFLLNPVMTAHEWSANLLSIQVKGAGIKANALANFWAQWGTAEKYAYGYMNKVFHKLTSLNQGLNSITWLSESYAISNPPRNIILFQVRKFVVESIACVLTLKLWREL